MKRKLNLVHLTAVTVLSVVVGLALKSYFKSDWFEFAGLVTGVVAVYLVAVEHVINWPIGLLNVSISAWVFFTGRLYADMSLMVFFFVLGVLGWWQWVYGGEGRAELKITRVPAASWGLLIVGWQLGIGIYFPITTHFNGAAPLVDSTLAAGSIIAQIMTNQKKLECWLIWILVDIAYIPLYISRGFYSFAVLYGLFLVVAVSGLVGWNRTFRLSQSIPQPR